MSSCAPGLYGGGCGLCGRCGRENPAAAAARGGGGGAGAGAPRFNLNLNQSTPELLPKLSTSLLLLPLLVGIYFALQGGNYILPIWIQLATQCAWTKMHPDRTETSNPTAGHFSSSNCSGWSSALVFDHINVLSNGLVQHTTCGPHSLWRVRWCKMQLSNASAMASCVKVRGDPGHQGSWITPSVAVVECDSWEPSY